MLNSQKMLGLATAILLAWTDVGSAHALSSAPHPRSAARDFGLANPAQVISVSVHLKLPNQALFNKTVDALYQRNSPTFHRWLTDAQLRQFGPPASEVAAVRTELERSGLSVASVAKDGFSIRAQGTIAAVSNAFHTEIHQFSLNGKVFRANTHPATLSGAAGTYVSFISGLERHPVVPMLARAINLKTKHAPAAVPLNKVLAAGGLSSLITDDILGPKQTFTFTNGGKLPKATYTGLVYDPQADPNTGLPLADYTPKQLQDVYGLTAAYKKGLDGTGQTIVLLEGYGYPTALADANAFARLTGLPPLNASNFSIVYPEGVPNPQLGIYEGWDIEIALDIQWAHSTAPGAKIIVVATNGQEDPDFEASMQYIIDNHLGNVVSDSWEEDLDFIAGPAEQEGFEDILGAAAAQGVSFQFSTGDSGDNGLGTPVGAARVPAVAPHATAVGGTAIGNVPGTASFVSAGWGDDINLIVSDSPVDPPTLVGFLEGGGGGSSTFWPKPWWQASLPGYYRQTPDISALADPFTGVPIVITDPTTNQQFVEGGWGGTSLASPIFTAIWAIADQRAGHPLGHASPTIAGLQSGVTDVLPLTAPFSGSVTDATGTTTYSANELFAPLGFSNQNVLATLWNIAPGVAYAFAFGYDSSLKVTKGWDNATGYGTPAGLDFINAAATY
jgi:subtilase family serine protease